MIIIEPRMSAERLQHEARVALYLNPRQFAHYAVLWYLTSSAERYARNSVRDI